MLVRNGKWKLLGFRVVVNQEWKAAASSQGLRIKFHYHLWLGVEGLQKDMENETEIGFMGIYGLQSIISYDDWT